ncbi:MAG: DUF998 domain-containing protein [Propionibacteriaceae bacterium]
MTSKDQPVSELLARIRVLFTGGGRLWAMLGGLVLLTYNTWLFWEPMNGHVAIFNGYLSEFSASDQPHNFFFRGGDLATAVIVIPMGIAALWRWPASYRHRPRWHALSAIMLALFGVSTFFDAFFSMDCSPSLSQACRVAEAAGKLSTIHSAHDFTSVGAQVGICGSMIAMCVAMFRSSVDGALRVAMITITAVESGALVIMMAMLVLGAPGLGYPQAVMVAVASIWFCVVGWRLAAPPSAEVQAVLASKVAAETSPEPSTSAPTASDGQTRGR